MSELIDRQAAIDALDDQIKKCCKALGSFSLSDVDTHAVKVEMASLRAYREMLENLPTIQPVATDTNVGDTISRQWLMECVNEGWIKFDTDKDANRFIHLVRDIAPSVQPEPKNGEWLPDNNNAYEMRFVCSCCKESEVVPTIGFTKYKPLWDFCPNCGAKMITK